MEARVGLFSRPAERMAAEALVDTPVVVVNGARQLGKSMLADLIVARSAGYRDARDQLFRAAVPGASDQTTRIVLDQLKSYGQVQIGGTGRAATWTRLTSPAPGRPATTCPDDAPALA